jgi:hypothetical protein
MLKLIGLLVVLAVAAYFTVPKEDAMRTAADAKLHEVTSAAAQNVDVGGTIGGLMAQGAGGHYDNMYVFAKYTTPSADHPLVTCYGAFTQTMCQKAASSAQ